MIAGAGDKEMPVGLTRKESCLLRALLVVE